MGRFLDPDVYSQGVYDHEGYAAQVLDDGTVTGTYSDETESRMVGQVVAACACGWAGVTRYLCPQPFDPQAEALALAEWETGHVLPVLGRARRARAVRLGHLLAGLAQEYRAELDAGQLRATVLDRTLRTLAEATELAQQLCEQVAEPEQGER